MKKKNQLTFTFFLFIFSVIFSFILCSQFSTALSIGVSPVSIEFSSMLRGGYAERMVTISTSDARNLTGHFIKLGEIADWMRIEPYETDVVVSSSSPFRAKVVIEPPVDVANGAYNGELRFMTDSIGSTGGQTGAVVRTSVTILIQVRITDQQVVECNYAMASVKDTETGLPLELTWMARNTGNVRISPKISVDIWDRDKNNLFFSREYTGTDVMPTTEKTFVNKISTDTFPQGQYWAFLKVKDCTFSNTLTFDVLEKGSISDKGTLISVSATPWAYTDDILPIKARFTNDGQKVLTAKFKGDIKLNNKIVQVINGDETQVAPGETIDLTTFFQPKLPGQYVVSGQVAYNKKLTYEKSTIINVKAKSFFMSYSNIMLLLLYVLIVVAIFFLIRRIRKSKRK